MKRLFCLFLFITIFISGCSFSKSKSNNKLKSRIEKNNSINSEVNLKEQNIFSSDITHLNPKIKNIISYNPSDYVNDIRCTYDDLNKILMYAKESGIENPYIPTQGVATDYIMEIRKEPDALEIVYPHFSICESSKEIQPYGKVIKEKNIKLSIGNGVWRETEGNVPQLYLLLNNIYITIDSAKPITENECEKVADSIVHIKIST